MQPKNEWFIWGAGALVFVLMLCAFKVATGAEPDAEPIARERVFNLPQDSDKWFMSVIGDGGDRHTEILAWFDENADLAELKSQVHFHRITTDSRAFKDRYAKNVTELPTIRVQKSDGYVVYEVSGAAVPDDAGDLLSEVAYASHMAGGPIFNRDGRIFPIFPIFRRPLLPYRYRHQEQHQQEDCDICPAPDPSVQPPVTPRPSKPEPKPDRGVPVGITVLLSLLSILGGGAGGIVGKWKTLTS